MKESLLTQLLFIVCISEAFTEKQTASLPEQQTPTFEKPSDTV